MALVSSSSVNLIPENLSYSDLFENLVHFKMFSP